MPSRLSCFLLLMVHFICPILIHAGPTGFPYQLKITLTNSDTQELTDHPVKITVDTQTLIADWGMQNDGDDIRLVDTDDTSLLDYWIQTPTAQLATTSNSTLWVKVPSIPANDQKIIYLYFGDASASGLSDFNTIDACFWKSVSFANPVDYTNPVIVATPVCDGGEETSPRIKNVTSSGFDVRLQNPDSHEFTATDIHYLVLEDGTWQLSDGTLLEADTVSVSNEVGKNDGVNDVWDTIHYASAFGAAPVVFSQVQTIGDDRWVTEHTRSLTNASFQLSLEVAEVSYQHNAETIGWIAWEENKTGTIDGSINYETLSSGDLVTGHDNNNSSGILSTFTNPFAASPIVIADLSKRDGGDGGWVSIRSLSASQVGVHCEEDSAPSNGEGRDTERSHTTEDVSIAAFAQAGLINNHLSQVIGETGSISVPSFSNGDLSVSMEPIKNRLAFQNLPQTIAAGDTSGAITIQSQNHFGTPVNVTGDLILALGTDSDTGQFSLSSSPFNSVSTTTIPDGNNSVTVYYRDDTIAEAVLTAAPVNGWTPAQSLLTTTEAYVAGLYNEGIKIYNNNDVLTNYQVKVVVDTASLISAGRMHASGNDIRFFDQDGVTPLPYWIETGINTTETRIWVKVPSIPVAGGANIVAKTLTMNYGNLIAKPKSSFANTMVAAEAGTLTLTDNDDWQNIILDKSYTDPVIVAAYRCDGGEEASPRIRDITSTTFQIKLQNPDSQAFTASTVNYMAMERGNWLLTDDARVEAGHRSVSQAVGNNDGKSDAYATVATTFTYEDTPLVFAQIMSDKDIRWVTENITSVTTSSFRVAMEMAQMKYSHDPEEIGYIIWEDSHLGTVGSINYAVLRNNELINGHDDSTANGIWNYLQKSFASPPLVIADMLSRNGSDGGWATIRNVQNFRAGIHIEEDSAASNGGGRDTERRHADEDISIIAFNQAGPIPLRTYAANPSQSERKVAQIIFTSSAQSILVDRASKAITIQLQDEKGNPASTDENLTINLTSTSTTGLFSSSTNFNSPLTSISIPINENSATFYYRDSSIGTHTMTASEDPVADLTDGTQPITLSDVEATIYHQMIDIDHTTCAENHTNLQVVITIDTAFFVSDGKMEADGRDIRFSYDEYGVNSIPFWIESGMNTNQTKIWLKLAEVNAGDTTTVYFRYGNDKLNTASNAAQTAVNTEVGSLSVGSDWKTIVYQGLYADPVIIPAYLCEWSIESCPRLKNVGISSADIRLHHPAHLSVPEHTVFYWIIDNIGTDGKLLTADGKMIETGTYLETKTVGANTADNSWTTITFDHAFPSQPYVFSQINSYNDQRFITEHAVTRKGYINQNRSGDPTPTASIPADGFLSAMEVSKMNNTHKAETIAWVAVEENIVGVINDITYEFFLSDDDVHGHDNDRQGNPRYVTPYTQSYSSPPLAITDLQSRSGGHGSWPSLYGLTTSGVGTHIEEDTEDTSSSPVRTHPRDEYSAFGVFSQAGIIPLRQFTNCNITSSFGSETTSIVKLGFENFPAGSVIQDESTTLITVETQAEDSSPINVNTPITVNLSSSSSGGRFSTDGSTWSDTLDITIASGSSTANFYYKDFSQGTATITASEFPSKGWTDAVSDLIVEARHVWFTTAPQAVLQGESSLILTMAAGGSAKNQVPLSTDTTVRFTSTSLTGEFSLQTNPFVPLTEVLMKKGESSVSFYYRDDSTGNFDLSIQENPNQNWIKESQEITIVPAEAFYYFDILTIPDVQLAGEQFFFTIRVLRIDNGALYTEYDGPVNITLNLINPITGSTELTLLNDILFSGGTANVLALYNDAGRISLTVTDNEFPSINKTSNEMLVVPYQYAINIDPEQVVARPFPIAVEAQNAAGQILPGFNRTLNLDILTDEPGILTPATLDFSVGTSILTDFSYDTWGTVQIELVDPDTPGFALPVAPISEDILFHPHNFQINLSNPPANRDYYYVNEQFSVTVQPSDFLGNPIPSYLGTIHLTHSSGEFIIPEYTFVLEDQGSHIFDLFWEAEEEFDITANDQDFPNAVSMSDFLQIKEGTLVIASDTVAVGIAEIMVKVIDSDGQILNDDNSTEFTISITEETANDSSFSETLSVPLSLNNGIGIISLGNTEAEEIEVSIETSTPKLPFESGIILFVDQAAAIGEGGIRIIYWREVRPENQ